jgi:hypothetical protein
MGSISGTAVLEMTVSIVDFKGATSGLVDSSGDNTYRGLGSLSEVQDSKRNFHWPKVNPSKCCLEESLKRASYEFVIGPPKEAAGKLGDENRPEGERGPAWIYQN